MNSIRTRDGRGRRRLSFSKALPVYNTEEEMLRNEKLQSDQVINTNMADLIAQSRAYIAVPTDQKDDSKAKKDDSANNKKSANDSKDSKEQHQQQQESKSETTTAPISPPSEEANKTTSTKADAEKEKAAAAPPAKKPVVAPKLATHNPNCTVKFAYKPMPKITAAPFYLRYKPPVIPTEHNFDWNQVHYEITESDIRFIKQTGLQITHQQFEKVIDIFEKLAVSGKDQSCRTLSEKFYEYVDIHYQDAITKDTLQQIYMQYWKPERECRKVKSFLRCFWENPEYNDQDPFSAFRNLKKEEKIKTRFNLKKAEDRFNKCKMIKEQSYQVIDMLPKIWNREAVKKALDVAHDAEFDLRYEAMCKEKGIANKQPAARYDIRALQAPQNASEHLKLVIKPPPRAETFKPPVSPHNNKKPAVMQNQQKESMNSRNRPGRNGNLIDEQSIEPNKKQPKSKAAIAQSRKQNQTDNETSATEPIPSESESRANPEDNLSEPSLAAGNMKDNKKKRKPGQKQDTINSKIPSTSNVPQTKKPVDVQNNAATISEPSMPEEKKDWTHCSFDMISMFTRMLSEMKKNDIDLSKQSFIQDKRYNLEELRQKATSIIQQVNNNKNDSSAKSISEFAESSTKEQSGAPKSQKQYNSPASKSSKKNNAKNRANRQQQRLLIRRGRNNMVYVRPILENVFDDSDDQNHSDDDSTNEDSANEESRAENYGQNNSSATVSNNKQQQNQQMKQRSSGMFMRRLKKFMRKKKIYADCKNGVGAWNNGFGLDGSIQHRQFNSANGDSNHQQEDEQPITKLSYPMLKDVQCSVQKQFLLDIVNDERKPYKLTRQSLMYCSLETALVREESVSIQEKEQINADSKSFGEKFKQFQNRNMLGSGKNRYNQQQSGGGKMNGTNAAAIKNTLGQSANNTSMNGAISGNNGHHYQQANGGSVHSQQIQGSNTTIRFSLPANNSNMQSNGI